jgi:hypothetical protein
MKITSVPNTQRDRSILEKFRVNSRQPCFWTAVSSAKETIKFAMFHFRPFIAANVEQSLPQTPFVSGSKGHGSALCSSLPPADRELVKLRSAV